MSTYAVSFNSVLSSTAGYTPSIGDVMCRDSLGYWVLATTANRSGKNVMGVVASLGTPGTAVQIQSDGWIDAASTGLGTGTASPLRVSSTGRLERVTSIAASDVFAGTCDTDGAALLNFGSLTQSAQGITYPLSVANGGTGLSAVGTEGQVLSVVGGAPAWASVGGWTTAYDVDLTAQGLQTITADGTYTVDGKTWTAINKANTSTFTVGGANGLNIACNATSSVYSISTRSCPAMLLPLTQALPGSVTNTRIGVKVTAYLLSQNCAAAAESALFAVETNSTNQRYEFDKYYNAGVINFGRLVRNAASVVSTDINDSNNADNVLQIEITRLGLAENFLYSGVYSAGWPTVYTPRSEIYSPASPPFLPKIQTLSQAYILLGACTGNTNGTLVVKWGRLKVEYRTL